MDLAVTEDDRLRVELDDIYKVHCPMEKLANLIVNFQPIDSSGAHNLRK